MKICEKCNIELRIKLYKSTIVVYCPECYRYTTEINHVHKNILVKYSIVNGFQIRNQCTICGCLDKISVKRENKNYPDCNVAAKQLFEDEATAIWQEMNENKKIYYHDQFILKHDKYTDYLNSVEWKEKRQKVLIRDQNICQACLVKRATEVHHLTYKHIYKEPLFDLISVCNDCHKEITIMDKTEPKENETPY